MRWALFLGDAACLGGGILFLGLSVRGFYDGMLWSARIGPPQPLTELLLPMLAVGIGLALLIAYATLKRKVR